MLYIVLIIAIVLACVAGTQYFYLMFLEARSRQESRRIADLERENAELTRELENVELLLAERRHLDGDAWPELLDEGDDSSVR
jgi:Tfp pilus assembly protein PilN